jgi:cobaltochelatase CobN
MHRLATTPGGWNPTAEGVILIPQTPAPIVFLTAADTDIQTLAGVIPRLPPHFPNSRVTNLLQLQQQLTIDTYADDVLEQAQLIVLRLLGGRSYWSYGFDVLQELVTRTQAHLIVIPGDDRPDLELMSQSTVSLTVCNRVWHYFCEGGVDNIYHAMLALSDACFGTGYEPPLPQVVPRVGFYNWRQPDDCSPPPTPNALPVANANVGILFYRAYYLAGNTTPIDALCQALVQRHLQPVPIYISSLQDTEIQKTLLDWFCPQAADPIQVLLTTTSFSLARLDTDTPNVDLWQTLDVPIVQVIFSSGSVEQWQDQFRGLLPRDMAMNVALPEVDGRIISRAVAFKAVQVWNADLETDVIGYEPVHDRINFVSDLAANWVKLRQTPATQRRVALILANYPTRDGRIANGVGLDTPASCVQILQALQQAGYRVEDIPPTSDELIARLTAGITNDPESRELRPIQQSLLLEAYQAFFEHLPASVQNDIRDRWGDPTAITTSEFPIPGIQLGHVFVGIQPARGYDLDPSLNYHAPDLEPPHAYLAFYHWVRESFKAQAIVHVGKHGNLEWLPGKSMALSSCCHPEVALGPLPHLYPFIVNDPGEGTQAKRRAQAVIIDHLTPPMTRAELYGPLQQLEHLIDEYYDAQNLDPTRLPVIRDRIQALVHQEQLHQDLNLSPQSFANSESEAFAAFLSRTDGYLCELKEAQIRDGLHILGQCPQGQQLRDLIIAIARHPEFGRQGLTRAIAQDWGLDIDPLTANLSQPWTAQLDR